MKPRPPHLAALRALADPSVRPRDVRRALGVETATRRWLIGGVLPLWLGAGLADWHRHRRTHIETTAGTRESMIHSLMMTEAGIPVALGLFCEVNPGVLATCAGALAVHGATAYWGVTYPDFRLRLKRRDPLSCRTQIALLTAMGVFGALPYAEEMIRCLRARPTLEPQPTATPAPTPTLAIPADPEHAAAE